VVLNPNKLFPRLSIRRKLSIAFALLAGIPLLVVGVIGAASAFRELRWFAQVNLQHDLELAEAGAVGGMNEIARHMAFLAATATRGDALDAVGFEAVASLYLSRDSSALVRVTLLDAAGLVVASALRPGTDTLLASPEEEASPLYLWEAAALEPGQAAFINVELRRHGSDSLRVYPAVAAIRGVVGPSGGTLGTVVGEASAAELFGSLEIASPNLTGETGLLGPEGFYLYHTEWKRDWERLLGPRNTRLEEDFGPEIAREILEAEEPRVLRAGTQTVVAVRPLFVDGLGATRLTLFRTVSLGAMDARVVELLGVFGLVGVLLLVTVMGLAVLASGQITAPVYKLRAAAHLIASGDRPHPLVVETNDELEDLAEDFNQMANALDRHRSQLEGLVEERTAQLRRAQAWLSKLVGSSADAIVGLDPKGVVTLWNRGAVDMFGYDEERAVGASLDALIGLGTGTEARFLRDELRTWGAVVDYRTRRRTIAGDTIPVSLTQTAVLNDDGELIGHSVIFRDDRPRELLEEQMRSSERLAAISLMAAGLAHELNNPLAVLGNRIELMQREAARNGGSQQLRSDLDVLQRHVGRIGSVTGDLLRFARDGADQVDAVEVNEVAERVVRLLRRVFVAGGVELELSLGEHVPMTLGNENVLETVLVNLLLNAQQATPQGGRVVLETSVDAPVTAALIEVRDTGPGVPADLRRRIFEPFFTTKAGKGGTGLGLAVCRALVDRLGGAIAVDDAPEGGARFTLTLPLDAHVTP